MHDAVEDRVGDGGVGKQAVPLSNGHLAGDNRGRALISIMQHFPEVAGLLGVERLALVIQDQDVNLGPRFQGLRIGVLQPRDQEFA